MLKIHELKHRKTRQGTWAKFVSVNEAGSPLAAVSTTIVTGEPGKRIVVDGYFLSLIGRDTGVATGIGFGVQLEAWDGSTATGLLADFQTGPGTERMSHANGESIRLPVKRTLDLRVTANVGVPHCGLLVWGHYEHTSRKDATSLLEQT